jgi:hypothetical protein
MGKASQDGDPGGAAASSAAVEQPAQGAPLPALPPVLERAGCAVAVVERQIAVLDRDGVLLERAPRKHLAWLWLASTHALIERQAAQLGLRQELHAQQALVRLWRPAQDAEGAPWRSFEAALELLAALAAGAPVELAQADDQAQTLPPPVVVVEAQMVRPSYAPQPRPRQRPGPPLARRWPALWRWVVEEARREQ